MADTGAPWNIQLFDDSFPAAPQENLFNMQSNNLHSALTSGFNAVKAAASTSVATAAARDALFPGTPPHGARVWRLDKGWEETYFRAYNATTNPGGAATAGWFPTGGAMPFYYASGSTSQPATAGTITLSTIWGAASTHRKRGFSNMAAGVVTIPFSGWYKVEMAVRMSISGVVGLFFNDGSSNLVIRSNMAAAPSQTITKRVYLVAGTTLTPMAQSTAQPGGTVAPNEFDTYLSIVYDGPAMPVG